MQKTSIEHKIENFKATIMLDKTQINSTQFNLYAEKNCISHHTTQSIILLYKHTERLYYIKFIYMHKYVDKDAFPMDAIKKHIIIISESVPNGVVCRRMQLFLFLLYIMLYFLLGRYKGCKYRDYFLQKHFKHTDVC